MGERLRSVDAAKGLLIISIVFIHVFDCQTPGNEETVVPNPILAGMYICLMLFFIISGYFYRPERSGWQNIGKRLSVLLVTIVVCMLVLPLIIMGYYAILGHPFQFEWYMDDLICIFGHKDMLQPYHGGAVHNWAIWVYVGYYFLQTMLIAFIIFYGTAKIVLKDWKRTAVAILLLVTATALIRQFCVRPPLYIDIALIAAAFMFVGAFAKKYDFVEKMEHGAFRRNGNWIFIIVALVAAYALLVTLPPSTDFINTQFGQYEGWSAYPFFIEAVICCFLGILLALVISRIPVLSDLVIEAGKHSLAIILLHIFVMKLLVIPFFAPSTETCLPKMPITFSIGIALLTLVICVLIAVYGKKLIKMAMLKKKVRASSNN